MFNKMKKMVAGLLATIMITTNVCPMFPVRASSGVASLESLGKLGTVNIGSKSESGTWLQTQVDSKPVFCMDLGKACHTGYTYKSESKTISSDDVSTKNKLEAKIGYWYDQVKKGSNKAWVYAQCLIWSVEEGHTSESNLKSVINQVKKNTGYYKDDSLYSDIFEVGKKVECDIYIWKYSGTTDDSEVQKLLQIKSTDEEYKYLATNGKRYYRQRITLEKVDEDGNALQKVAFRFTAKNIKELYSYQYNGWGDSVKEDADEDATKFSQDVMTDSNGKIVFRFTYILNSKKYYYVSDDELSKMSSSEKKQMKDLLDDKGYNYASDLSKAGAEKLKEADLDDQMDDISNKYVIEEVNSGNDNILTSFVVDKGNNKITDATNNKVTVTLTKADSWTRNSDGKWPETAEESYSNYKLAYKLVLKDKYKKVKLTAVKIDEETGKVAQGNAILEGAVYGVYSDVACTKLIKSYTTDKNYQFETDYMRCGKTYYLKEITSPKGYLKNDKVYDIVADGTNFTAEYNSVEKQVSERPIKGDV